MDFVFVYFYFSAITWTLQLCWKDEDKDRLPLFRISASKLFASTQVESLRQSDQELQLILEMYERESTTPRFVR